MKKYSAILAMLCICGMAGAAEIGTYTAYLQPTSILGVTEDAVKVTLKVTSEEEADENGNYNYFLSEIGDTDFFFGYSIPFVYRTATKQAEFSPSLAQINGQNIYVSAFVWNGSFTEPQPSIPISFTPDNGFNFKETEGIGFFTGTGTDVDNFTPYDVLAAYYVLSTEKEGDNGDGGEDGEGVFPPLAELAGRYTFSADVTYAEGYDIESVTEMFADRCEFTIEGSSISGFIGSGTTIGLAYSTVTGVLTLQNNILGSTILDDETFLGADFGYAGADGEWTGTVAMGGAKPEWQVGEDGEIVIPDFTVVNWRTSPAEIVAWYKNCTVTASEGGDANGIEAVVGNGDTTVRYFNLQGVEIKNPGAGQILIRVEGNKAVKVVK